MLSGYGTRTYAHLRAQAECEGVRGRKREQPQAEKRLREIRGAYVRAIADASVRVGRGWKGRRRGSYINKHRTATEEDGRELLIKGRVQ